MQKFNYHSHTYRCGHADLDVADEEYIKEYIENGFTKMAFTDHCPEKNKIDIRKDMRMDYSQKEEYLNSVKCLKEKYAGKIEIQSGFEVEYLPGEEDNLKELKNNTDKLILGQHFIYDNNNKLKIIAPETHFTDEEIMKYAEYLEIAMELKIPDIIAHPDIYMMSRESFGEQEKEVAHRICKVAEKNNIPLEINLCKIFNRTYYENKKLNNEPIEVHKKKISKVSYPNKGFWEVVSKYDVKVLYGIDAHHKGQISKFHELVELANEIIGKETIDKLSFIEQ